MHTTVEIRNVCRFDLWSYRGSVGRPHGPEGQLIFEVANGLFGSGDVDGVVEFAVPALVEPVTGPPTRAHLDRRGAVACRELGSCFEPSDVADITNDLSGADRAYTVNINQAGARGRHGGGDPLLGSCQCRVERGAVTDEFTSSRRTRLCPSGLTRSGRSERNAAIATELASFGSFFWERPEPSTRTLDANIDETSNTTSPAATSCWATR